MAIGRGSRQGGIGKAGKKAGPIGKSKSICGSALTEDQDRNKLGYPTTTSTTTVTGSTTTTAAPTTTTTAAPTTTTTAAPTTTTTSTP